MPTLEERVALLEQEMNYFSDYINNVVSPSISQLPTIEQRLTKTESDITNLVIDKETFNQRLTAVENDITQLTIDIENLKQSGETSAENVNKLIDILYNFSKAKYNFVEYSQAEIDFYKSMQELKGVEVVG